MEAKEFMHGYNTLCQQNGLHKEAMMDIGVYVFEAGETRIFEDAANESAFLLLGGSITINWGANSHSASRGSLFDEKPTTLHASCSIPVTITAQTAAEVLIQKTANEKEFAPVLYTSADIQDVFLGAEGMDGCAKRILRDIFNYGNAPYSNMVLGEDMHLPGRWSSYPPHHHPQPEVYFHRFNHPQGFGVSIIGDEPRLTMNNSISVIPGGLDHPQAAAPGYAMYYAWMIRHLDGNPWTDRIDNPLHTWLHDKDAPLWQGPPDMR